MRARGFVAVRDQPLPQGRIQHKARERVGNRLGRRVLDVVHRLAREHPGDVSLAVSHADPLQAAWVLLDGRPQNEREMARKTVGRASILQLDLDGERVVSVRYLPAPKLAMT